MGAGSTGAGPEPSTRRTRAAAGTFVFLVVAPGVVAGLVPWLLTGWEMNEPAASRLLRPLGVLLIAAGTAVVVASFARFVHEGAGTPAPVAPTETLVVGGFYRYVRNPRYIAVGSVIVGQALLLGQPVLLAYAVLFAIAVASFVHWYEEPTLGRRFDGEYEAYRRAVRAWLPRRHPWEPQ